MLSTLGLDRKRQQKNHHHCLGPSFDHPPWRQLPCTRGPVKGPLLKYDVRCVLRAELRVLSLSQWRKIGLPLALWQESGPNFKGLPKVSGVTINHWVFLRCDWSPVSS